MSTSRLRSRERRERDFGIIENAKRHWVIRPHESSRFPASWRRCLRVRRATFSHAEATCAEAVFTKDPA
jgi:hypothetical protein